MLFTQAVFVKFFYISLFLQYICFQSVISVYLHVILHKVFFFNPKICLFSDVILFHLYHMTLFI